MFSEEHEFDFERLCEVRSNAENYNFPPDTNPCRQSIGDLLCGDGKYNSPDGVRWFNPLKD